MKKIPDAEADHRVVERRQVLASSSAWRWPRWPGRRRRSRSRGTERQEPAVRLAAGAVQRALAGTGTRHRLGHEDHLSRNGARVRVLESADGEPGRPHADARAAAEATPAVCATSPPRSGSRGRRLAGLAVRRPGHAPLRPGRGPVRRRAARRRPTRATRRVGWYSSWIQAAFLVGWALGGGFFGRVGDLHRPQPRALPDDPHLRAVHRPVLLRADVVAPADLPVPGRPRDRRRVGGRGLAAVGDLAAALAALDRGRAPDRRQHRRPARLARDVPAGGPIPQRWSSWSASCRPCSSSGSAARSPRPRNGTRPAAEAGTREPRHRRPVPRRRPPHDRPDDPGLLRLPDGPLGVHVLVLSNTCGTCPSFRRGRAPIASGWSAARSSS